MNIPRKIVFQFGISLLLTALVIALAVGRGNWAFGQDRRGFDCAPERGAAGERWFNEGAAHQKAGRMSRAVEAYRSAIRSCSKREELLRKISRAMGRAGLREETLKTAQVLANLLLERGERKKLAKAHQVMSYTFNRPPPEMAKRMQKALKRESFPNFQADFTKFQGLLGKGAAETRFVVRGLPHFKKALEFSKTTFGGRHPLTFYAHYSLGKAQFQSYRVNRAQANYEKAWRGFRGILGADHSMTLSIQASLGSVLESRFKTKEAEKILTSGLKTAIKTYGARHGIAIDFKSRLSNVYIKNGRVELSLIVDQSLPWSKFQPAPPDFTKIKPYIKALKIRTENAAILARWLGEIHPSHQAALIELADLYVEIEQSGRALSLWERVVSIRGATLGERHPQTFAALMERGKVAERLEQFGKAAGDYRKVYDGRKKTLGGRNYNTRRAMLSLARTLALSGRGEEGLKLLKTWVPAPRPSRRIRSRLYADGHLEMAGVLAALGRHEAARPLIESAKRYYLPHKPKNKGPRGMRRGEHRNGYGRRWERLWGFEAASLAAQAETLLNKKLEEKAIAKLKQATALDVNTTKHAVRLAEILGGLERPFQASLFYQQAVARAIARREHGAVDRFNKKITLLYQKEPPERKKLLERLLRADAGMKPTDTVEPPTLGELAKRLKSVEKLLPGRKFQQALAVSEDGLKFARRNFSRNGAAALVFQFMRALILPQLGKNREALKLLEKITPRFVKVYGAGHPWTGALKGAQISLYTNLGNFSRAEPIAEELAARSRKALGSKHPVTLGHLFNLAFLYSQQGRKDKGSPISREIWKNSEISLGRFHPQTLFYMQGFISTMGPDKLSKIMELTARLHYRGVALKGSGKKNDEELENSLRLLFPGPASEKHLAQKERDLNRETREFGPGHWRPFYTRLSLAGMYRTSLKQGHQQKSAKLYLQSYSIAKRLFGPANPATIGILSELVTFGPGNLATTKAKGRLSWDAQLAENRKWENRVEQWLLLGLTSSDTFLREELWGAEEATREAYLRQLREFDEKFISFHDKRRHIKNRPAKFLLRYSLLRKGLLLDIAAG